MATRARIVKAFNIYGLSLQSEASRFLGEVLSSVSEPDFDGWLQKIIQGVQKQELSSSLVNKAIVEVAVQEYSQQTPEDCERAICVISAFEVPRLKFNAERKKFVEDTTKEEHLHPEGSCKADMLRERYIIIYQRTVRHDLFSAPYVPLLPNQVRSKCQLKRVENLLGSSGKMDNVVVLGMIAQIKLGKYYLEDNTGAVPMDLSKTRYHSGLFTENCFILAEGFYEDGVFHVDTVGMPPSEPPKVTRAYFGNMNFFGGPSKIAPKASEKLREIEEENREAMFVILSDVYLDLDKVMKKLRALLLGYNAVPPAIFIFCGNFISEPYGYAHSRLLRERLNKLADLISEFPALVSRSRFVFVPGPDDPGSGYILPRPPLPSRITKEFREKIPLATFTTNPCRIQYCTQEIVVLREDLVNRMCRNTIHRLSEGDDAPSHLVKTIMAQSHLCPLPIDVRPVFWNYDTALRIYPVPDLVILADKYQSYVQPTSLDCICVNPGSFSRNDYSFKVYWPALREVEDSKIDENLPE